MPLTFSHYKPSQFDALIERLTIIRTADSDYHTLFIPHALYHSLYPPQQLRLLLQQHLLYETHTNKHNTFANRLLHSGKFPCADHSLLSFWSTSI